MKIIVMDSANVHIEVLNVPDPLIEEGIEQFWQSMTIRSTTFLDGSNPSTSCQCSSMNMVSAILMEKSCTFTCEGKLKDFSIYDSVQEVKHREQGGTWLQSSDFV